jgi:hypothetical protein
MALRNAFANLLTESMTGAVEAVLTAMGQRQERQAIMEQPRDLQYARTITDAMRVNIENAQQAIVYAAQSSASQNAGGISRVWGDPNAIFMVDERWQQSEQSMQTFNQVRATRWVIS